jgi:hypothetical protein
MTSSISGLIVLRTLPFQFQYQGYLPLPERVPHPTSTGTNQRRTEVYATSLRTTWILHSYPHSSLSPAVFPRTIQVLRADTQKPSPQNTPQYRLERSLPGLEFSAYTSSSSSSNSSNSSSSSSSSSSSTRCY